MGPSDSVIASVFSPDNEKALKQFVGGDIESLVKMMAFIFQSVARRCSQEIEGSEDYGKTKQVLFMMLADEVEAVEGVRGTAKTKKIRVTDLTSFKKKK
jgi:hypothetical protein